MRYLSVILREKIIKMTVELGHHIPQPRREVMSGKIQTGQIPLNTKVRKKEKEKKVGEK